MENFHELAAQLRECRNETQLLKVATYISNNSKKLKLTDSDIDRLEQIGVQRYEEFRRERDAMIRNKKQGFNNFGD